MGESRQRWRRPVALTVAGSDSSGGAGIQADLKTFQALGVYGVSVITAVTAQNTVGVYGVHEVPASMVADQFDAVAEDIGIDALKTGMLSSPAIIGAVADCIRRWHLEPRLVVDPVMIAKSGDRLLREDAVHALLHDLLPLASVVTPNLPEAEVLVGHPIRSPGDIRQAAREIVHLGPRAVVMKGCHAESVDAVDVLFDGDQFYDFSAPRIQTSNTHGTGCTFSSAIASNLAQGLGLVEAVGAAQDLPDAGNPHGIIVWARPWSRQPRLAAEPAGAAWRYPDRGLRSSRQV